MMRVTYQTRLQEDGREVVDLQLVNGAGMILRSIRLRVRDGKIELPVQYAPTIAGALDYGRALWEEWIDIDQRLF